MSQLNVPQPAATQPAEPKKASPIRLIVLLVILAIVLGGFLVDMFVMYDSVKAASKRLETAANEIAEQKYDKSKPAYLNREGVAKAIGFQPTNSSVEDGQLRQHYRWWGALPLQRRFIVAIYEDAEGERYSRYEISNRNIYGQDEDDETERLRQQQLQQQPTEPGVIPSGPPMPTPGTDPMPAEKADDVAPEKEDSDK